MSTTRVLMKTVANQSQSPTPKVMITRPTTDNSAIMLIAIPVSTVAITVFIVIIMVVLYSLRSVSRCLFDNILVYWFLVILLGRWSDTNQSQREMKCSVVGNPAYDVVHVQGSAGDGLEPDYNMENNPLYEMRIKLNERPSHKTETAAAAGVYDNVDNAALWGRGKLFPNSSTHVFKLESSCINIYLHSSYMCTCKHHFINWVFKWFLSLWNNCFLCIFLTCNVYP